MRDRALAARERIEFSDPLPIYDDEPEDDRWRTYDERPYLTGYKAPVGATESPATPKAAPRSTADPSESARLAPLVSDRRDKDARNARDRQKRKRAWTAHVARGGKPRGFRPRGA